MNKVNLYKLILKAKYFFIFCLLCSFFHAPPSKAQTPISEYLFGQNAWMPDSIENTKFYGKLDELWSFSQDCNLNMIRVGGIAYDNRQITNFQIINLIDSIRNIGAEPLIQVSWKNGVYTATQAADMVNYVNNVAGKNIKFWSISNEPVVSFGSSSSTISTYIKSFSTAMKQQDSTIKIVGPDLAWYNTNLFNNLLGGSDDITGINANGHYYIDVVSFHIYTFNGSQTRAQVESIAQTQIRPNLTHLQTKLLAANTLHSRAGLNKLRWGVGEFNINTQNPIPNTVSGIGVNSFINGQLWAEMFGLGMEFGALFINPWSIHESAGNGGATDFGYIGGNGPFIPRPNYYHEQLLAKTTRDTFANYTSNIATIKTFGNYDADSLNVILLNVGQATYAYELFNNSTNSSSQALIINTTQFNLPGSYVDSIESESTQLLVFDKLGNFKYKYCYSLNDAINNSSPSICQTTVSVNPIVNVNKNGIFIFPNPTKNSISIEGDEFELKKISVFNLLGYDLSKYISIQFISKSKRNIDLSKIPAGSYIIKTNTIATRVYKE